MIVHVVFIINNNFIILRIYQNYLILEDQYNGLRKDMLFPVYLLTIVQDHTYLWWVVMMHMTVGYLILIKEYGNNW